LQIVGEQSGTVDSTDASSGGTEAPDKKAKITLTEQEEKFAKQFLQELFSKFLFRVQNRQNAENGSMGSQLRYGFRNRLKCHLLQSNRHGFRNVLSSKWTGVSLKGYRQNGHETGPGGEKANQLFNTTCNK
jgi:hypothetical protein